MAEIDKTRQSRKVTDKTSGPKMPHRVPLSGLRDRLEVMGKDPDKYYRWVKDRHENGEEINRYKRAGYSFVNSDDVTVGEDRVFKSESFGSIVMLHEKEGGHLYLMCQPMEYRLEDIALGQQTVDETEESVFNPQIDPLDSGKRGQYGKVGYEY